MRTFTNLIHQSIKDSKDYRSSNLLRRKEGERERGREGERENEGERESKKRRKIKPVKPLESLGRES